MGCLFHAFHSSLSGETMVLKLMRLCDLGFGVSKDLLLLSLTSDKRCTACIRTQCIPIMHMNGLQATD